MLQRNMKRQPIFHRPPLFCANLLLHSHIDSYEIKKFGGKDSQWLLNTNVTPSSMRS
jgi:hypothetical protein